MVALCRLGAPLVRALLLLPILSAGGSAFAQDGEGGAAPPIAEDSASEVPPSSDTPAATEPKARPSEPGEQGSDTDLSSEAASGSESEATEGTGKALSERIRAVTRQVFVKAGRFEAAPFLGLSVNDAFYQRVNGGLRLSFHIFEWWSIEGSGAVNPLWIPLPSARFLRQSANDEGVQVPIFWGHADVGTTIAPIYGKFSLMSEYVIHFDAYVNAGVGLTVDSHPTFLWGAPIPNRGAGLPTDLIPNVNPMVYAGVGARVFLFPWLAIRVDVRDMISVRHTGNQVPFPLAYWPPPNLVMLNLGLAFYFPFNFEYDEYANRQKL